MNVEFTVKCTVEFICSYLSFTKGKRYKVLNDHIYDDLDRILYVGKQAKCAKDVVFTFRELYYIYSIDFEDVDAVADLKCDTDFRRKGTLILDEMNQKKRRIKKMDSKKFLDLCINEVVRYFNGRSDTSDSFKITEKDVFVVWSCKTLQNNKALLSTNVSDGMYYELTFNGDKQELYFDAYKKWENRCIKL